MAVGPAAVDRCLVRVAGGAAAGPAGSLYLAGSLQGGKTGAPALIVKLNHDGALAFDRGWGTGATAAGVSIAP